MSENNEGAAQEGITVPVKVGAKQDVTVLKKHSNVSALFINLKGQAHMVPLDMAKDHAKKGKGFIIEKDHAEYMKFFKMATGFDEKLGTKKFSQVRGKIVSVDDTVSLDIKATIDKEEIAAAKARKDAEKK